MIRRRLADALGGPFELRPRPRPLEVAAPELSTLRPRRPERAPPELPRMRPLPREEVPDEEAPRAPRPFAPAAPSRPVVRHPLIAALRSRSGLSQAVILSEILGPPKALRPGDDR